MVKIESGKDYRTVYHNDKLCGVIVEGNGPAFLAYDINDNFLGLERSLNSAAITLLNSVLGIGCWNWEW